MDSFFFLCGVLVSICEERLVGGGLPFKQCPAVDVFGICCPCPSIVRSPQWRLLSSSWAPPSPCMATCILFLFFSFSWSGGSEIRNRNHVWRSSPPTLQPTLMALSLTLFLSRFTSVSLALRPRGSQHYSWALLLTQLADWQLNMFIT